MWRRRGVRESEGERTGQTKRSQKWDQRKRVRGGDVEGRSAQVWEHASDGKMDRWQNRAPKSGSMFHTKWTGKNQGI